MTWKTLFVLGLNYLDTLRPDIPDVVLPNLPNGEFLQRKIRRHSAEHLFDIYSLLRDPKFQSRAILALILSRLS